MSSVEVAGNTWINLSTGAGGAGEEPPQAASWLTSTATMRRRKRFATCIGVREVFIITTLSPLSGYR